MSGLRLELLAGYGDQTLPRVRFVAHGATNIDDAQAILSQGLHFIEGRPIVSTNLVNAQDWTASPTQQRGAGKIIVCAVPTGFHLGYGVFTTAYLDRPLRRVIGAPIRYASGRNQLALYSAADTDAIRRRIESEVAGGYVLTQHPQFVLGPEYIIGSFDSRAISILTKQLDVAVRGLQSIDFAHYETALGQIFEPHIEADAVLVPTAMRDIAIGTAESIVMSVLRMMRWQGLQMLGFSLWEGKEQVHVSQVASPAEQRQRMDEFGRRLASSALFNAELAWLKVYATHMLELMRLDLEAAELDSIPD